AKIVFHPSRGGEDMQQALEALAAGALLFQEAGNQGLPDSFQEGKHYVGYRGDNLEGLLEHLLTHEEERQAVADAGRCKAAEFGFGTLLENILSQVEEGWQTLVERSQARPSLGENDALLARTAQLVSGADPNGDPTLVRDLAASLAWQPRAAPLQNALGLAIACSAQQQGRITAALAEQTVDSFRRAVAADPAHVVAGLNLAHA